VISVATFGADEREPNDTIATAMPTGLYLFGSTVIAEARIGNGTVGAADRDLYSCDVPAGLALPVALIADVVTRGGELDAYVRLFDETGLDLARADGASITSSDPRLRAFLLEPGTYYVGVSGAENPNYRAEDPQSGRASSVGEYGLTLFLRPAPEIDGSVESDDENPTPVSKFPFIARRLFIGDGPNRWRDVDRFRVTLDPEKSSRVQLRVSPDCDGDLEPYVRIVLPPLPIRHARPNWLIERVMEGFEAIRPEVREVSVDLEFTDVDEIEFLITGTVNPPQDDSDRQSGNNQYGSVGFYDIEIDVEPFVDAGGFR